MPSPTDLLITGTIVLATAGWSAAAAHGEPPIDDLTTTRCEPLDGRSLDVTLTPSGELLLVYGGDEVATCNEAIVVSSYASTGPSVDNHVDPLVDQIVLDVAELEAAGPTGVTVAPVLDACWAGLQVHRDGDTLLWEHVEGDGCDWGVDALSGDSGRSGDDPRANRPHDALGSTRLDDDPPAGSTIGGGVRRMVVSSARRAR